MSQKLEDPAQARVRVHNEAVAKSQSVDATRKRHTEYARTIRVTRGTARRKIPRRV